MKILFLAPQPFYVERGTPIAVRLAVTALCQAGHEVDLLVFHEGDPIEVPGLRILRIKHPPFVRGKIPIGLSAGKLVCDLWLVAKAFRLMAQNQYDVVHTVEESVFPALLAKLIWRFKLIYDMDSLMADQIVEKWPRLRFMLGFMSWFETQANRRADLVLAVCPAIANRVWQRAPLQNVHLLPDVAFPRPEGERPAHVRDLRALVRPGAPLLLYVGNMEAYQGVDLLVDAMARLSPGAACELVAIGGQPEHVAALRARAQALGIAGRVHLLGPAPFSDLPYYLDQADILCSPRTKGVNTPMKIYSYLASGRAVIATDIPSHTQILDDDCALLVPATAEALARAIDRLSLDPEHRARLGEAGRLRAQEKYSLAAFERRLELAYGSIMSTEQAIVPSVSTP